MNILYLAHRLPFPPNKGDKLRSYHQLTHLARNHLVSCACFVDTPEDVSLAEQLETHCHQFRAVRLNPIRARARGLLGMVRGRTITESYYDHAEMWRTLRAWLAVRTFDVVVAFSSSMSPYALAVPAKRRVLDLCDLDSEKWRDYAKASRGLSRLFYQIEARRLARRERVWVRSFDATLLITEQEAKPLRPDVEQDRIHIMANGVTIPDSPVVGTGDAEESSGRQHTVGFIGAMDYRPNVDAVCWFVKSCWAAIRRSQPNVVFRIVGRSPHRRVRALSRVPGVEVVGSVVDIAPEVRSFDVSVAPLRIARGLQNKVLEAMAYAKPVVLTSGAAAGIGGAHGREYLIADEAATFTDQVLLLLHDASERRRLGDSARRFVQDGYNWDEHLRRFELVVTGAVERSAPVTSLKVGSSKIAQLVPSPQRQP